MADRKSSENPTLTELADDDLFDVLDFDESVTAEKNKSMRKADLFTQIANELALTSDSTRLTPTAQNGWSLSTSSYYRKVGKTVFVNIVGNASSATSRKLTTLPVGFRPNSNFALAVAVFANDADAPGIADINENGEVSVIQAGTLGTIPGPYNYNVSGAFDVD